MPHFTCESCGAGLYSAAHSSSLIDPSCPSCGAVLQAQREIERWDGEGGRLAAAVPAAAPLELRL